MGNTRSEFFEPVSVDLWWNNDHTSKPEPDVVQINDYQQTIYKANEANMEEVNNEISSLHEKRRRIISEKKKEMDGLRQEVARQKKQNEELKEFLRQKGFEPPNQEWDITKVDVSLQTETFEVPGISNAEEAEMHELKTKVAELELELGKIETIRGKNLELQKNIAELQKELQSANSELAAFETERKEYKTHVIALKDIIAVSKQLLLMRENQIKELTKKVDEIQASLAERELKAFSDDLRQEYQRQLQNIKQLRVLYEERQRADKTERDRLKSELEEATSSLKSQETKNSELQERVDELEKDNSNKYDTIVSLESQLGLTKAECGELRAEMSVINQLFSQILLGFNNGQEIDLDKLIKTLEENHDLLTEIVVNEESNELSSALPKVLLDLVSQVNEKTKITSPPTTEDPSGSDQTMTLATIVEESESQTSTQQNSLSSASEIVQNLPKVWKVLTELLSHQTAPVSVLNENNDQGDTNPCYKSVQTPTGPTLVLSVSKTFIRLKNLIVEKKSLEKETTRLKQLNTHLETRLQDQEKRLGMVSHELSKTWHVVGKMQKQHQQLHTQEKILRYELAQKRKLLNELKEELEYCREKWLQAREKNSTTEEQWKQLRNEFAARKNTISEDLNNSVESGYSDERESSSSDDDIEDEAESPVNPEIVPGPSSAMESLTGEDATVSEAVNLDMGEPGPNEGEPSNGVGNDQTILEVVQDEIAKIESNAGFSGESSSTQLPEDVQVNVLESQEPINDDTNACELSKLDNESSQLPTRSEDVEEPQENEMTSNGDGPSTSSAFSNGTSTSSLLSSLPEPNHLENNAPPSEMDVVSSSSPKPAEIFDRELEESENETTVMAASSSEENCDSSSSLLSTSKEEECFQLENSVSLAAIESPSTSSSPIVKKIFQTPSPPPNFKYKQLNGPNTQETSCQPELTNLINAEDKIEEVVLNKVGSTAEVHSGETLKTDVVQNEKVQTGESSPYRTHEEILAAKEERLRKLEEQTKDLIAQTASTSNRGSEMSTKLDNLHEQYGGDPKSRRKDIDDMYKKLEEDILQTIKKTQSGEEYPSTSKQSRSTEEILAAREERLKRLEEQSNELINHAARTSNRGREMSSKLDSLHQHYTENPKTQEEAEKPENVTSRMDEPSTSSARTPEEILARREERLQSMEEQAQQLVRKARRNSLRSLQFCSKLNKLHDRYGESSDSSDDGADDNNNNADGDRSQAQIQNGDVSINNEAQLDLEEAENAPREERDVEEEQR